MADRAARPTLLKAAAVALAPLFFYGRAAFSADVFLGRDLERSRLPLLTFFSEQVRAGHFPGWFPYDGLGQPFVGMTTPGTFSPFTLLHLVLAPAVALKWTVLLAAVLSFSGAVFWARSRTLAWPAAIVAGSVFAFSAYLVGLSNNPQYLMSACALPWLVAFGDRWVQLGHRPSLLGGAAFTACVALAGDPMNFAVALGAIALLSRPWEAAGRAARLVRAAGLAVGSVGLAMAQVLPSLATRAASSAADQGLEKALTWSAHPLRLLEWMLGPVLLDGSGERVAGGLGDVLDPGTQSTWVDSQAIGALPLALAALGVGLVLGRRAWPWLAGWGLVFLLWLGRFTPAGGLAYRLVPLWKSFRYPEKLTPWLLLGVACAAAMMVDALGRDERIRVRAANGLLLAIGVPVALVVAESLGWLSAGLPSAPVVHQNVMVLGSLSAALLLIAALSLRRLRWPLLGWMLAAAVALTDYGAAGRLFWTGPAEALTDEPELAKAIRAAHAGHLEPPRLWSRVGSPEVPKELGGLSFPELMTRATAASLRPAVPALHHLTSVEPYLPAPSARERTLGVEGGHAALWGTRYVVSIDSTRPARATALVETGELGLHLDTLDDARPYAFLAQPIAPTAGLDDPRVVTGLCATVEGQTGGGANDAPPGEAQVTSWSPDEVRVHTSSEAARVLVLNDAWYPGWSAAVDGEPAPVQVANGAVRGVLLAAGSHEVVFTWHTPGLAWGLAVSGLTLLALLGAALVRTRPAGAPATASGPAP